MGIIMKNLFSGVDHPAVASESPAELAQWYCDRLGYELFFVSPKNVQIIRAADGSFIEIMPRDATARPERTTWTPGWSHLALRVANLDEAAAFLESKGVSTGPLIEAVGGGRLRTFYDPEGNMLQIVERPR